MISAALAILERIGYGRSPSDRQRRCFWCGSAWCDDVHDTLSAAARGRAGHRCRSSTCWAHAWTSSRVCVMRYTRSWCELFLSTCMHLVPTCSVTDATYNTQRATHMRRNTRTWAFGKASSQKRWARLTWPPRCRTRRPTCRPSRPSTNTYEPPPSCDTPSSPPPLQPPPRTATTAPPPPCPHNPRTTTNK